MIRICIMNTPMSKLPVAVKWRIQVYLKNLIFILQKRKDKIRICQVIQTACDKWIKIFLRQMTSSL